MIKAMNKTKIFKALSNKKRLLILEWLRDPHHHFASFIKNNSECADSVQTGVCVTYIQKKSELSQSTVSQYLGLLQEAGLVYSTRVGQWTYYKRDNAAIIEIGEYIKTLL